MALDSGNHTHLLYVIDDASFYETDWRIRQIVSLLGASTPFHLGKPTDAISATGFLR